MGKIYLAFVDGGHAGLLKDGTAKPAATPGKETPVIKSLGRRIQEEEFNAPTAEFLRQELLQAGVHVYDTAPGEKDTPLKERTNYANEIYRQYCDKYGKANVVAIYVSIHFNAFDGKFDGPGKDPEGYSVHVNPGSANSRKLAQCIIDELKGGTSQKSRGIVEQNLHITRETIMPAVLTESGFMDNEREALLMLNVSYQKEVAVEHAKGICKYFCIPYKAAATQPRPPESVPVSTSKGLYKVQVGAFGVRANAVALVRQLKEAGIDGFIAVEGKLYKVQVGAFSVKDNADALQSMVKKAGFAAAYVKQSN